MTLRVDAHHHFWDPARYSYPWMAGDAMDPVRRAFTPDDLRGPLSEERIDGTVLVLLGRACAAGPGHREAGTVQARQQRGVTHRPPVSS